MIFFFLWLHKYPIPFISNFEVPVMPPPPPCMIRVMNPIDSTSLTK